MMLKSHSLKKGLAVSILINFFSKALSFLVNILIVNYFAVGATTDVFFYASIFLVMAVTLFSNMNSSVIIPEFIKREVQQGDIEAKGFFNMYLLFVVGFLIVLSAFYYINPIGIAGLLSNFDSKLLEANQGLILWLMPVLFLQVISTVLSDLLVSRRYFIMPMVISLGNSLLVISLVILFHEQVGIVVVFYANILAFLLSVLVQGLLCYKLLNWKLGFVKLSKDVWKDLLYANIGVSATIASTFLPIYLLSMHGNGLVTSLNLGQRIAEVPSTLIVAQVLSVVGVQLNDHFAHGRNKEVNQLFTKTSSILVFILVPITAMTFVLSDSIINILFVGRTITTESLGRVSLFLKGLILACPFYAMNSFVSRLFMASRMVSYSFYFQIVANIVLCIFTYVAIKFIGPEAYPWAYFIFFVINFFGWEVLLRHCLPFIEYRSLYRYILLIVLVNGLIALFISIFINTPYIESHILRVLIVSTFYLAILLPISYALRLNSEVYSLVMKVRKKLYWDKHE